ncbi:hypothetical protein D9M71_821520 [compost metagenome]
MPHVRFHHDVADPELLAVVNDLVAVRVVQTALQPTDTEQVDVRVQRPTCGKGHLIATTTGWVDHHNLVPVRHEDVTGASGAVQSLSSDTLWDLL